MRQKEIFAFARAIATALVALVIGTCCDLTMDLTPKPSTTPWSSVFACCRPPSESASSQSKLDELQKQITDLTTKNEQLEEQNVELQAKLEKETRRKSGAKERREKLKSKLAKMSSKLKTEYGDDFDDSNDGGGEADTSLKIISSEDLM